jgi:hypothetical protein
VEIRIVQVSTSQIGPREVCMAQPRAIQVCAVQVGLAKNGTA